jgi:SAM-dependent methyltransferase
MGVKMYYTIRELSARAVEMFAFKAMQGEILVPGCGTGHDVRAIAMHGGRVLGLDLSETALRMARSAPRAGEEIYEQANLFDLPTSWAGRFDWVVEHTCFCAIPPIRRSDYLQAITRVLKPGGHYLGIFYMNPAAPQGPPHCTTKGEIASLFDPYFTLIEEWIPQENFEGREGRELCQLRRKAV